MKESNTAATGHRKSPYFLGIAIAILNYVLSLFEPAIRGSKLLAISLCAGLAVLVSVLKLRNLRRGTGWVFPGTASVLILAVSVEVGMYLSFSH